MRERRGEITGKRAAVLGILLCNVTFLLLYSRFIVNDRTYLYIDNIGADAYTSSFPILALLSRMVRNGVFGGFSLTAGLGMDMTAIMAKYLNPLKAVMLLFDESSLYIGILLEMFLQTNVIAVFSLFFFRRLLKEDRAAVFAALSWTFCGYITLWSQNLTIGSCMAMFTVLMAALLPVIEEPTLRRGLHLSLAAGLFLITNYYYCYIAAFFCVIFYVFCGIRGKMHLKTFFVRGLAIVASVLFAAGLAMIALVPSFADFSGSVRSGWISNASSDLQVLTPGEVMTAIGRIFSVNTFGIGDYYRGRSNYYEEAVLSTSLLAWNAVTYLLLKKRTRLTALAALTLCVLSLYIKNTGAILQFNSGAQRYSFLIAFTAAIAVGAFFRELFRSPDRRILRISAVITLFTEAGTVYLLQRKASELYYRTDRQTLLFSLGFAAVYAAVMLLMTSGLGRKKLPLMRICALVLVAELVVMNYGTLYYRRYVTKTGYADAADAYGTGAAAKMIGEEDDGLYRISAMNMSHFPNIMYSNAGMLLDFAGTSVYSSTNPASLGTLTAAFSSTELTQNHFICEGNEFGIFTLLSGKYLIRDNDGCSVNEPPSALFEKIGETADGRKSIYRNRTALPFGYFYTEEQTTEEAFTSFLPERVRSLGSSWYLTPDTDDYSRYVHAIRNSKDSAAAEYEGDIQVLDIRETGTDANQVVVEQNEGTTTFRWDGSDPYLYYDIGEQEDHTYRALYLRLADNSTGGTRQMQIFFMNEEDEIPDPNDALFFSVRKYCAETLILLPDDVTKFRLDFPQDGSDTVFREMAVLTFQESEALWSELAASPVEEISMEGGVYTAKLTAEKDGMFCVPVLYTNAWKAYVNGEEAEICNINGGLVGIRIGKGTAQIELRYETPQYRTAAVISLICLAIWLILYLFGGRFVPTSKKDDGNAV